MNKPTKWNRTADFGSDELLDVRQVGARCFQFVRIMDMEAVCGTDNEGRSKYAADLSLVDLDAVGRDNVLQAAKSWGCDDGEDEMGEPLADNVLAEMCHSYGSRAPLWDESSNNWNQLLREARREANDMLDADALSDAMERPVNGLGSTAAEYMCGDITSAMTRGVMAGDPGARITAKMYGIDDQSINDARPADWMPFFIGYIDGFSGRDQDESDDLAPEYLLGFKRGVAVCNGTATCPGWIDAHNGKSEPHSIPPDGTPHNNPRM